MQSIQASLKFFQDNLAVFSFFMSLLALVATWGNFWNARRAFLASNYPKIQANFSCLNQQTLPVYDVYNESDKITANNIQIEISIRNWSDFNVFKGKWLTYTYAKLARLKPLESFVPSGLSSDELCVWLKDRGYEPSPLDTVEKQKISLCISEKKSYSIRLIVNYTSNLFGADRVCKITKVCQLISCSRSETIDPRDKFYWKLKC